MLVVIEEYTGKMTAYPDIAYLHRGSGYDKRHAGSFKGKKIKQSFFKSSKVKVILYLYSPLS